MTHYINSAEPEFIKEFKESKSPIQKFIDKEEENLHEELL